MEINAKALQKALVELKEIHGVKWNEMHQLSGVHNIGRIAYGDITPTADSWQKLHKAYPGEIPEIEYIDTNGRIFTVAEIDLTDFILIPKYKSYLTSGPGSLEDKDQIESNLSFRKDWINKKTKKKDFLVMFEVLDMSMAPFMTEGDVVLVDLSENNPNKIIDGKTYAIRENDRVKIKRLLLQNEKIIIRSQDKENYPDYEAGQNFSILWRVIWLGHEVV